MNGPFENKYQYGLVDLIRGVMDRSKMRTPYFKNRLNELIVYITKVPSGNPRCTSYYLAMRMAKNNKVFYTKSLYTMDAENVSLSFKENTSWRTRRELRQILNEQIDYFCKTNRRSEDY